MNRPMHPKTRAVPARPLLAACLAGATLAAHAHPGDETGWYGTGALARSVSVSGGGPEVSLGGGVQVAGSTDHGTARAGALAIGHEWRRLRDGEAPRHVRLEGEWWSARLPRESVRLGTTTAHAGDAVRAQALFVNGLVRLATTEHSRWWAGAGLGWASVRVPDGSALFPAFASCGCLRAESGSGLAWRLKLQGERAVSEHAAVFAELAYTRLPTAGGGSAPAASYGGWGVTTVGVGVRLRFHALGQP